MACRGSGVRVSLATFNKSPASGWVFLLPIRGDDSARCPVLAQKDEALQVLGAHLAKGSGLGTCGWLRAGWMDGQEIQEVKEGEADLLCPAVA